MRYLRGLNMFVYLFFSVILVSCTGCPPTLKWVERFDVFDLDTWSHVVTAWDGGNNEFQYYRNNRANSFVKDGLLHIRPTFVADEYGADFLSSGTLNDTECNRQPCAARGSDTEILPPVFSARITTERSFSFKYGRLEVRAKMPRGDWLWPAIWLLPVDTSIYGGWPMGGEIDLSEIRGNRDLKNENKEHMGIRKKASTLHFGPNPGENKYYLTHFETLLNGTDFSDDFHTFGMEWTNKSIKFTLDGMVVGKVAPPEGGFWELGQFGSQDNNIWKSGGRMAPFDQKFYIILNVAVGGHFFSPNWQNGARPRPWTAGARNNKKEFWNSRREWLRTWDRPEMLVDHILVYGWD